MTPNPATSILNLLAAPVVLEGLGEVAVPLAVVVLVAELEVPVPVAEAEVEAEAEVDAVELLPAAATTPPRASPWGEVACSTFLAAVLYASRVLPDFLCGSGGISFLTFSRNGARSQGNEKERGREVGRAVLTAR